MSSHVRHPLFARMYAGMAQRMEALGTAEHRDELLAGLAGTIIEVGAGSGLNFAHYPTTVTTVIAVEPEPHLRSLATRAAAAASVPVTVVDGLADELPAADGSCDAAVTSLVMCSVPHPAEALSEIQRVLRPGGELRFYEHVRSNQPRMSRWQDRVNPLWQRIGGGCNANRDTLGSIVAAGFNVTEVRRFGFSPNWTTRLTAPHILGTATV